MEISELDLLLIDGQNIGYAAQRSPELSAGGEQTQAIYYSLRCMKTIREKCPNASMVMLWDDRAQWRYDLLPTYKASRSTDPEGQKMREGFNAQRKNLNRALAHLGIDQIKTLGLEADDMAGVLVQHAVSRGLRVGVVSSDKDWIQLVSNRCVWIDVINDRMVTAANFKEFTSVNNVEQYIQAKAIEGDKSDEIEGIPGLGKKAIEQLFDNFPNVQALWKHWDEHGPYTSKDKNAPEGMGRYCKKLNEFCDPENDLRKRFALNYKLMNLLRVPAPPKENVKKVPGTYNLAKFQDLCGQLAFNSITARINEWTIFNTEDQEVA